MNADNLHLELEEGNTVDIADECKFVSSKIIVKGKGNKVVLAKTLVYNRLFINLSGNNKEIIISESSKNINKLKVVSHRGNNQRVLIGKSFGCGGVELQMNDGNESVLIGDDCLFSWGIKLRTSDGHSIVDLSTNRAINLPRDIVISDRVWVCEDVKILKGSYIPHDVIVGAGAVVTKCFHDDTDSNSIIAGFPAKVVKRGVRWDRRNPLDFNVNVNVHGN